MDYGFSEKRKSRTDKRAKARFTRYKKGGGKHARGKEKKFESRFER